MANLVMCSPDTVGFAVKTEGGLCVVRGGRHLFGRINGPDGTEETVTMDKKTEYVEKLSAQMVEWDAQIDRLKYQADSAAVELNPEYRKELDALLQKRKGAELKLQGISTASDDLWEELKDGTDSVWDEVSASLRKAVLEIK